MVPDRVPYIRGGDPTQADAAAVLAENNRVMRELIEEIRKAKGDGSGNGGGNSKLADAAWRIGVAVAVAGVLGLFGLLQVLHATVAVQAEQIERVRVDLRDANAWHQRVDDRLRSLERGGDRP